MSKEEEYNNIFREKLDERSFEVNEEKWQNALQLLENKDKKKKRGIIMLSLLLGILGILTGWYLLSEGSDRSLAGKSAVAVQESIPENKNQETINKTENKINPDVSENSVSAYRSKTDVKTKESTTEKVISQENTQATENNNNETANKTKQRQVEKNPVFNAFAQSSDTKEKKKKMISDSTLNHRSPSELKSSVRKKSLVVNENNNKSVENLNDSVSEKELTQNNLNASGKLLNNKEETEKKKVDSTTNVLSNTIDTIAKVNETKNEIAQQKKINDPPSKKWALDLSLGMLYSPKNKTPFSDVEPVAGALLSYYPSRILGFGIGSFYNSISSDASEIKRFKSTKQDFGYQDEITEISITKMRYLNVPLYICTRFGKSELLAGIQYSYLLTTQAKVVRYTESYGNVKDQREEKASGYMNGMRKSDLCLSMRFQYSISQKIRIGVGADYGFYDVKENNYFNTSSFNRNVSCNLFIKYRIFNK